MKYNYYKSITMIEKLHRLFMEVIKQHLWKLNIKDINNVQCSILYNIYDKEVNVGSLIKDGYYQGSNVSYNLRKMVENGYISQRPSQCDRRVSEISLTEKGLSLHDKLTEIFDSHSIRLQNKGVSEETIDNFIDILDRLEKFLVKER